MKRIFILGLIISFYSISNANTDKFYGGGSQHDRQGSVEGIVTFEHFVHYSEPSEELVENVLAESVTDKQEKEIYELIEFQLWHLFGSLLNREEYMAITKGGEQEDYEIIGYEYYAVSDVLEIYYEYTGKFQLEKEIGNSISFYLPNDPNGIYTEAGTVEVVDEHDLDNDGDIEEMLTLNPCTNHKYNEEDLFWYFWDPANDDCPLEEDEHFETVVANIVQIENTKITYPEYNKLAQIDSKTLLPIIKVSYFLGAKKELKKIDLEKISYGFAFMQKYLVEQQFEKLSSGLVAESAYLVTYEKQFQKIRVIIDLYYGNTGVDEKDVKYFYRHYSTALKESSAIFYGGHSGFGDGLNLDKMEIALGETLEFNKNYQIYFINSCSSYPYYNEEYITRKRTTEDPSGTKTLDIVSTGISAYFGKDMGMTATTFMNSVVDYASEKEVDSWQTIIDNISNSTKRRPPLLGVNGDEDNPIIAPGFYGHKDHL